MSFQKNFPAYTLDKILSDLTLENIYLYQRATPLYDDEKTDADEWDDRLDANNPENFNQAHEEEFVR